ncbi:MAG: 50S ribosomal protein L24 [Chlamydiia bacterium]|nr:50S ribosomal protein L24 [Chlamydiia bacterium]
MSKWIKKDDKVLVLAGNDKGKVGTVIAKGKDRLVVQGVNMKKKHLKQRDQNSKSEIIDIETPIHISNVAPCTATGVPVKLKVKNTPENEKYLYYVEEGKEVVFRTLRKAKKK